MRSMSQIEFGQLCMKLAAEKDKLQEAVNKGNLSTIAIKYKVPLSTMRGALQSIGVTLRSRSEIAKNSHPFLNMINNLNTVVRRLCTELKVDCSEIEPKE